MASEHSEGGNDGLGNESLESGPRASEEYQFTDEQKDAIATLASKNVYTKQSKWKTFRELPTQDKWPFFVQHFLLATVAIIAAIAIVISLVVTYVTKDPDPVLAVQGLGMPKYSKQFTRIKQGFLKQEKIDDERLVDINGDMSIAGDGYTDDSAKIMTMVTAGQINMMFASKMTFTELNTRGYISKPKDVLSAKQLATLETDAVLVDAKGNAVTNAKKAVGLDLSKSKVWKAQGLPDDAILGFSNVKNGKQYPRDFVAYLKFE